MTTIERDRRVSAKILAHRAAAGNPNTQCPLCLRRPESPTRVYDDRGKVVQGCIDAIHTGQLVSTSESNRWHLRPWPMEHRASELATLDERTRYYNRLKEIRL